MKAGKDARAMRTESGARPYSGSRVFSRFLYVRPESEVYTMEEISTIIQQVGFPIAAFLLMWWQSNTTIKENTAAIVKLCEHMSKTEGDA